MFGLIVKPNAGVLGTLVIMKDWVGLREIVSEKININISEDKNSYDGNFLFWVYVNDR